MYMYLPASSKQDRRKQNLLSKEDPKSFATKKYDIRKDGFCFQYAMYTDTAYIVWNVHYKPMKLQLQRCL